MLRYFYSIIPWQVCMSLNCIPGVTKYIAYSLNRLILFDRQYMMFLLDHFGAKSANWLVNYRTSQPRFQFPQPLAGRTLERDPDFLSRVTSQTQGG